MPSLAEQVKNIIYGLIDTDMKQSNIPELFYNWYVNKDSKIPKFDVYSPVTFPAGYITLMQPKGATSENEISDGGGAASSQLMIRKQIVMRARVTRDIENTTTGDNVEEWLGLAEDAMNKAEEDITRFFSQGFDALCNIGVFNFDFDRSVQTGEGGLSQRSGDIFHPYFIDLYFNYEFYRQRGF